VTHEETGTLTDTETTQGTSTFSLSHAELEQFHRDGYIGPFDLYEEAEMQRNLQALRPKLINTKKAIYNDDKAVSGVTNLANYDRHLDVDFLAEHITRPEIVDRVSSLARPGHPVLAHRVLPQVPRRRGHGLAPGGQLLQRGGLEAPADRLARGRQFGGTITVWTAFTEASTEDRLPAVHPGSHRTMNYDESKTMDYDARTTSTSWRRAACGAASSATTTGSCRRTRAGPGRVQGGSPGDAAGPVHHLLVHPDARLASAQRLTDQMRLGFAARYLPTSVRVYPYSDALEEFGGAASLEVRQRADLGPGRVRPQQVRPPDRQRLPLPGAFEGMSGS
jgi:non-heme Fe2+,alpha-ketoglutarate-dependent halogenase